MATHIALLRGINVGGRNVVAMAELRELATHLGFTGAQTLLQSGNLVFQSGHTAGELESVLESEIERRLKLHISFVVRTREQWEAVVAQNPFPEEAANDPAHLVAMFMKRLPEPSLVHALQMAIQGPEVVRLVGGQLYVTYPAGVGPSKLTGALIESKLGARGTARNWNTVLKLADLVTR